MKALLISFLLSISILCIGQDDKINQAKKYLSEGKIFDAKEIVDQLAKNSINEKNSKFWLVKGEIYRTLATSMDANSGESIDKKAHQKAVMAYVKVLEIEQSGSFDYKEAARELAFMYAKFYDDGIDYYQKGNFKNAFECFVKSSEVYPDDTLSYLYGAAAAQAYGNYKGALYCYYPLLKYAAPNAQIYMNIINIEKKHNNYDKAIEIVKEALTHFNYNIEFRKKEIKLLMLAGRLEETKNYYLSEIGKNPKNPQLYFNLGFLYDESSQIQKAIETYEMATFLKPNFFEANFNLASKYSYLGKQKLNAANNITKPEDNAAKKDYLAEGKNLFTKSLPYWEATVKIKPNDISSWENLYKVYKNLEMKNKANSASAKLRKLKGK